MNLSSIPKTVDVSNDKSAHPFIHAFILDEVAGIRFLFCVELLFEEILKSFSNLGPSHLIRHPSKVPFMVPL